MWKTQIIKAFNSDALADKVSAALNKLQDSPEVKGTISIQYTAASTIETKYLGDTKTTGTYNGPSRTVQINVIEYSCMLVYDKVRSFDHLAIPTNETSNP